MSEISNSPEIISKSEMVEGPKSTEVTEKYLRLNPEGRAKINYIDGLLDVFTDTPDIKLKNGIVKHIENIENPKCENYEELLKITPSEGSHVISLSILPDGKTVLGSNTGTIRILNSNTGFEEKKLEGHGGAVNSLSVFPDGRIVSGSTDNSIRVWNPDTGNQEDIFNKFGINILKLDTLSNDRIVYSTGDKAIYILNLNTPMEKIELKGHTDIVYALSMLVDGRIVTGGSKDETIRIWNPNNGKEDKKGVIYSRGVRSLLTLPNGRIVTGSKIGLIEVFNSNSGSREKMLLPIGGEPTVEQSTECLSIFPNGKIVFGEQSGLLRIWNLDGNLEEKNLEGHERLIDAVFTLPDGRIFSASGDQTIRIWGDPNIDYKKFYDLAFPKK
jgi:WD40 repeat protein